MNVGMQKNCELLLLVRLGLSHLPRTEYPGEKSGDSSVTLHD